jgi:hypothetical protein
MGALNHTHGRSAAAGWLDTRRGTPEEIKTEVLLRVRGREVAHVSPGTCKGCAIRNALRAHPAGTVEQVRIYVPNAARPAPENHHA